MFKVYTAIAATRQSRLLPFLLWGAVFLITAANLRASWDVQYARQHASQIRNHLRSARTSEPACVDLRDLVLPGLPKAESPDDFHFYAHGLHCKVWRNTSDFPCSVIIQIGNPVLYRQVVLLAADGHVEGRAPVISGGVLRSLRQNRGAGQ